MAKSQLRGNREAKKPKQPKKPSVPAIRSALFSPASGSSCKKTQNHKPGSLPVKAEVDIGVGEVPPLMPAIARLPNPNSVAVALGLQGK